MSIVREGSGFKDNTVYIRLPYENAAPAWLPTNDFRRVGLGMAISVSGRIASPCQEGRGMAHMTDPVGEGMGTKPAANGSYLLSTQVSSGISISSFQFSALVGNGWFQKEKTASTLAVISSSNVASGAVSTHAITPYGHGVRV
jgi:hypothetical protein